MAGPRPDTDGVWALRGLRASPPGRAAVDKERRSVFTSALEQAEQFLTAAAQVGFATKPVQLFYALSQAGRAIAAVHAKEPWRIAGHGASVSASTTVGNTRVTPTAKAEGALRVVASATRSPLWDGAASLAVLWASLPELDPDPLLCGDVPAALEVEPCPDRSLILQGGITSFGYGLTTQAILPLGRRYPDREQRCTAVAELLKPYPRANGWSMVDPPVVTAQSTTANPSVWFGTAADDSRHAWLTWRPETDGERIVVTLERLTEVVDGRYFFRPAVDQDETIPSRLVTWWGVLLALASLARYEPVAWRAALDIDASTTGWALERGLTAAQRWVPELVVQAITYEEPPLY